MELIDGAKINGFMKLWLYQFYVLSHLSWPFMINDLNKTFAQELQRTINPRLKKWAGIGKTVDNGPLFRSKRKLGLGLTSIFDYFQRMQLVKCEIFACFH